MGKVGVGAWACAVLPCRSDEAGARLTRRCRVHMFLERQSWGCITVRGGVRALGWVVARPLWVRARSGSSARQADLWAGRVSSEGETHADR